MAPVAPQTPTKALVVAVDAEIEGFGEMFAGGKSGPEHLQAITTTVSPRLSSTIARLS